jgi:hypothetical protein
MKLMYRGLAHSYDPPTLEEETPIDLPGAYRGTYRGVPYHCTTVQVQPILQPSQNLSYRGVPYAVGERLGHPHSAHDAMPAVVPLTQVSAAQVNQIHADYLHRNLDRRLQRAQERGDSQLVALLEQERHQLVAHQLG